MYGLEYAGHWLLKNVEPGSLFRLPGGGIALMTEYGDNSGHRHKYMLDTGESCWADPNTEVIVLKVVDTGEEDDYLKPSDKEYVPRMPREIPLGQVPQASRDFAAGKLDAFDKEKRSMGWDEINERFFPGGSDEPPVPSATES